MWKVEMNIKGFKSYDIINEETAMKKRAFY